MGIVQSSSGCGLLGGLRGIELRSITFGKVTLDNQGVWVEYAQAKRKGEEKQGGDSIDILRFMLGFNNIFRLNILKTWWVTG